MSVCSHVIHDLHAGICICVPQTVIAHAADKSSCSGLPYENCTEKQTKHHHFQSMNSNCYCSCWLMSSTYCSSRKRTHKRSNLSALSLSFPRPANFAVQSGAWQFRRRGAHFVSTQLRCTEWRYKHIVTLCGCWVCRNTPTGAECWNM